MIRDCLFAAVIAAALATPAAASLLVNGDFEADDASVPTVLRQIPTGWSAIPGFDTVDIVHNSYTQPAPIPVLLDAQSGDQFLDVNGGFLIGGIRQTVVGLTPGAAVMLSLYAGRWVTNSTIGGVPAQLGYSLLDGSNGNLLASGSFVTDTAEWTRRELSATVPLSGSVRVQIQTLAALQAGPGLDNVALVEVVPEPASWALMIAGFGLVGAALRHRRAAIA